MEKVYGGMVGDILHGGHINYNIIEEFKRIVNNNLLIIAIFVIGIVIYLCFKLDKYSIIDSYQLKDFFQLKDSYSQQSGIKNIIILASGPPKKNRNRHLEVKKNKVIITDIIEKCNIINTKLYIVINPENEELIKYINDNHSNVNILYTQNLEMLNTLQTAFKIKGDCILVMGDLVNLKYGDVDKFINTDLLSAICKNKTPWGNDLQGSGNLIRKGNISGHIIKICENHKKLFLSQKNINQSKDYFKMFYPNGIWNPYINNHLYTWLVYSFFINQSTDTIYNKKNINNDIGFIEFNHNNYDDND